MPHLKVKKFDTGLLDGLISSSPMFLFKANHKSKDDELLGVNIDGEEFVLEIKSKDDTFLIKSDSISRPSDTSKIKKALGFMQEFLDLDVVNSNINYSETKPKPCSDAYKRVTDFLDIDFTDMQVAIEVGFGSGRHLLHQAKMNPQTTFIGIEIHTPSIEQVLKQINLQGLDNVWIVNYDARLLMEMLPSNISSDIYVHFPVPWDKKEHRRVISKLFIKESLRVLKPEGRLELRTDSQNYYHYSKQLFKDAQSTTMQISKNTDAPISSKYEDRWRAQDKDIYTLTLTSNTISPPRETDYDFSFDQLSRVDRLFLDAMPKKAFVFEDYFVHFEGQYILKSTKEMLIRCAFGSFDRPEHKYLKIGTTSSYYPHNPVPSSSNFYAHKKIGEMIYG